MPEIKKPSPMWLVDIIESERGCGRKIDEQRFFDNYEDAVAFQKDYNKNNAPGPAPDWYMQAENPVKLV